MAMTTEQIVQEMKSLMQVRDKAQRQYQDAQNRLEMRMLEMVLAGTDKKPVITNSDSVLVVGVSDKRFREETDTVSESGVPLTVLDKLAPERTDLGKWSRDKKGLYHLDGFCVYELKGTPRQGSKWFLARELVGGAMKSMGSLPFSELGMNLGAAEKRIEALLESETAPTAAVA